MRLIELTIENYKAFEKAKFTPEKDATVLLGTNGAGKTSLVEVLGLLGGMATESDSRWLHSAFAVRSRSGFAGCLPWQQIGRTMRFEITAQKGKHIFRYSLGMNLSKNLSQPLVVEEDFWADERRLIHWDAAQSSWILESGEPASVVENTYPFVLNRASSSYLFTRFKIAEAKEFVNWVAQWKVFRPNVDRGSDVESADTAKNIQLEPHCGNFAAVLSRYQNPSLKERYKFVQEYTDALFRSLGLDLEWGVSRESIGSKTGAFVRIWEKGKSPDSYFDVFFGPDGIKQWFMVLTAITQPESALIIIEEPERHLDPRMMELLVEAIKAAQDKWNFQSVLTTQSPFFASPWEPAHMRLLRGGKSAALPKGLRKSLQEDRIKMYEAWMMDMLTEAK